MQLKLYGTLNKMFLIKTLHIYLNLNFIMIFVFFDKLYIQR